MLINVTEYRRGKNKRHARETGKKGNTRKKKKQKDKQNKDQNKNDRRTDKTMTKIKMTEGQTIQ
jgi:hypothetical protein